MYLSAWHHPLSSLSSQDSALTETDLLRFGEPLASGVPSAKFSIAEEG